MKLIYKKKISSIINSSKINNDKNIISLKLNITHFKITITKFIRKYCKGKRCNVKKINKIAIDTKLKYGNALKALNNLIFICEIIECKSVLVENNIWNIKNQIKYEKYNITIDPVNFIDCFNQLIFKNSNI